MVPAPITATCFTAMLPPLSDPSEKCLDLPARQCRLLVVHEMSGLGRDRHLDVAEELVEPVGPFALEHGVAGAPKHARRHRDRQPAAPRRLAADHGHPRLVSADVPVEAALEIARLHEVVDPGVEILVESVRIMRPMPKEMPDVQSAGLSRASHQRRGPWLLVEGLIPDLLEMLGRRPARTDPRIRAIEEE